MNLLQTARKLNQEAEKNVMQLGLVLLEIENTKAYEEECASFGEWCVEELGRSKGFISKLLIAATFLKTHGFLEETNLSVTKLYSAIKAYPDKTPHHVLKASKALTLRELEAEGREEKHGVCTEHLPITICSRCHQRLE